MSVSISNIIIIETKKPFFEVGLVSFIFLLTIDYKLMFNVTPQFNMLCFAPSFQVLIDLFHLIPYNTIILCIGVTLYTPGKPSQICLFFIQLLSHWSHPWISYYTIFPILPILGTSSPCYYLLPCILTL